ncbi:hypothetical protein [Hamadaea tsunoensis]|uniref:hypothetical protein n=1 Tax=Hamadaea tsunoensis TaxID=53368 RepID=UPI00040CE035|nr:hypothetical protein [Hamadaea tsunoensis]
MERSATEQPDGGPAARGWARSPLGIAVISAVLTTVGAAAVAVFTKFISTDDRPAAAASAASSVAAKPSPSTTGAVDPCLVGIWKGLSYSSYVKVDDDLTLYMQLRSGDGFRLTFTAGGTATQTLDTRPTLAESLNGSDFTMVLTGTAGFDVTAGKGRMVLKGVAGEVASELHEHKDGGFLFGKDSSSTNTVTVAGTTTSLQYECSAGYLVLTADDSKREYQRAA